MTFSKIIEKTKNLKSIYGIEWLLVILAISYFDASVAMLLVMFGSPIFGGIHFIIKFLEKKKFFLAFKLARATSVLMSVIATIFVITYCLAEYSPQNMFQKIIANPAPTSIKNIETYGSISAMGSSSFQMTFEVSHQDFELIVRSGKFSNFDRVDLEKMPSRVERCLNSRRMKKITGLIENISEVYVFTHSNSKYRCDFIMINKDQNKAIYGSI